MPEAVSENGCGFYGKIPARGDFVGSGLNHDFVEAWDAWLQDMLSMASEALADEWSERYLNAPIWRFALESGVCGETGMMGIVMVSVDAVGRFFPLTVACVSTVSPMLALGLKAGCDWFERAETIALGALVEDSRYEDFLAAIEHLAAPALTSAARAPMPSVLTSAADPISALLTIAAADVAGTDTALWWSSGSNDVPPALLRSGGLPSSSQAIALFDGRWTARGWHEC